MKHQAFAYIVKCNVSSGRRKEAYRQPPGRSPHRLRLRPVGGRIQTVGSLIRSCRVPDRSEVSSRYRVHRWAWESRVEQIRPHRGEHFLLWARESRYCASSRSRRNPSGYPHHFAYEMRENPRKWCKLNSIITQIASIIYCRTNQPSKWMCMS